MATGGKLLRQGSSHAVQSHPSTVQQEQRLCKTKRKPWPCWMQPSNHAPHAHDGAPQQNHNKSVGLKWGNNKTLQSCRAALDNVHSAVEVKVCGQVLFETAFSAVFGSWPPRYRHPSKTTLSMLECSISQPRPPPPPPRVRQLGQGGRGRSQGGERPMGTTAYGGKGSKGRAANGDRPVGAASCRRDHHTMASCQPPPPPSWRGAQRVGQIRRSCQKPNIWVQH